MPLPVVCTATFVCHPESHNGAVATVGARVWREPDGALVIRYSIEGDVARLRVPAPGPPRMAQGLWRRTCCECFIATEGNPDYHEFNFSPSGEWAAYSFSRYREGAMIEDERLNPQIAVRRLPGKLELDATIPLARLADRHTSARLALALSAVIEDENGALSYWALRHPAGKPDFHHPDSFVLELDAP